ncbi:hypothetical protein ACIP3A_16640 [Streptomyces tricolor]|uniref:hypothetical protein n=1 Tax=Streptomyces tricolor TaxID=68277 RepID=UPI0037F18BB2
MVIGTAATEAAVLTGVADAGAAVPTSGAVTGAAVPTIGAVTGTALPTIGAVTGTALLTGAAATEAALLTGAAAKASEHARRARSRRPPDVPWAQGVDARPGPGNSGAHRGQVIRSSDSWSPTLEESQP